MGKPKADSKVELEEFDSDSSSPSTPSSEEEEEHSRTDYNSSSAAIAYLDQHYSNLLKRTIERYNAKAVRYSTRWIMIHGSWVSSLAMADAGIPKDFSRKSWSKKFEHKIEKSRRSYDRRMAKLERKREKRIQKLRKRWLKKRERWGYLGGGSIPPMPVVGIPAIARAPMPPLWQHPGVLHQFVPPQYHRELNQYVLPSQPSGAASSSSSSLSSVTPPEIYQPQNIQQSSNETVPPPYTVAPELPPYQEPRIPVPTTDSKHTS
ncbi:hypothetical protein BJ742DRAFT_417053 [Cladochytrium replicatum]|nr:hypothetical protein BJ742DRAFT_417053 [Cladochytrium replicatum]